MDSKATRSIAIAAGLCAAALAGCAATPEQRAGVWLDEAPRTLAFEVDPGLPAPALRVDHTTGDRVANGVGGALYAGLYTVAIGCAAGPFGCALGAIAAPFTGTVAGVGMAASTRKNVKYFPLDKANGAAELTQATLVPAEVAARLEEAVLAAGKDGRHVLRLRVPGEPSSNDDGSVRVIIDGIYLDARTDPAAGEDAEVVLVLSALAAIRTPVAMTSETVSVESSQRLAISEWRKDGEKLFREELRKMIDGLGSEVVKALNAKPGVTARTRVAITRENEARRQPGP